MPRIVIKGGAWKNTEDEILKAAVMKYGKNQWPRISSLLVKKTPKQCKARWYEWLDPSIKKTDWSREEDEKLLHLAKLMPTQWRTIAPLVGRTAAQCLERYQKLLDEAEAQGEGEGMGLQGPTGGEGASASDDVRRLRPGEIDPNPETKSARPDPVDMDEDEKEMLSEARARLANTQGKKAKRKARERQLEEARRLATLQKRRELKAAGIEVKYKKKLKHMDYNADIPLEKRPLPGFHDTTEEMQRKVDESAMMGKKLQDLEPKKRWEIEEEERLKEIKRKREKQKNVENPAALHNRQKAERIAAAAQAEKEEAEQLAKRKKLQLPAPQITDQDLETILQIGQQGETARELVQSEHTASGTLLGDYTTATPGHDIAARTPRINTKHDTVMAEARNLRALAVQQTPLLGEENPVIQESQGTGFDGVTPRSSLMQTPNPLMTPMRGGDSAGQSVFAAPGATPMRDELGLNAGTPFSPRAGGLHRAGKDLRVQLAKKLAKLPAPRNEFEIIVPEQPSPEQGAESSKQIESDQEAVDKMRRERLRAEEEARLRRRSQAVQRDLPRPASFESLEAAHDKLTRLANEGDVTAQIQRLILEELERMVLYDAANHPVPHSRPPKRQIHMEPISDEDLQWAREAVTEELNNNPIPAEVVIEASNLWKGYEGSMVWVASKNEYLPKDELTEEDWVDKFRAEWKSRRERMTKEADRAAKIEKRLGIKLGGYQARAKVLAQSITKAHEECDQAYRDLELFRSLKRAEDASIPSRLESAEAEVREVERREDELQSRYSELVRRRQALLEQIQAASNGEVAT